MIPDRLEVYFREESPRWGMIYDHEAVVFDDDVQEDTSASSQPLAGASAAASASASASAAAGNVAGGTSASPSPQTYRFSNSTQRSRKPCGPSGKSRTPSGPMPLLPARASELKSSSSPPQSSRPSPSPTPSVKSLTYADVLSLYSAFKSALLETVPTCVNPVYQNPSLKRDEEKPDVSDPIPVIALVFSEPFPVVVPWMLGVLHCRYAFHCLHGDDVADADSIFRILTDVNVVAFVVAQHLGDAFETVVAENVSRLRCALVKITFLYDSALTEEGDLVAAFRETRYFKVVRRQRAVKQLSPDLDPSQLDLRLLKVKDRKTILRRVKERLETQVAIETPEENWSADCPCPPEASPQLPGAAPEGDSAMEDDVDTSSMAGDAGSAASSSSSSSSSSSTDDCSSPKTKTYVNQSVAYVMRTSGSTGSPKVVRVTHAAIIPNIDDILKLMASLPITRIYAGNPFSLAASSPPVNRCNSVFLGSPLTFDPSIVEIFVSLATFSTLVMTSTRVRRSTTLLEKLLKKNRITFLQVRTRICI